MRNAIVTERLARLKRKHLAAPLAAMLDAVASGDGYAVAIAATRLAEETAAYEVNVNRLNYRGAKCHHMAEAAS